MMRSLAFMAAAVFAGAVAAPAMAFEFSLGHEYRLDGNAVAGESLSFEFEADEPATLELAFDILPPGTELDDAAHEAMAGALCQEFAGEPLTVLGIPVEAVQITLWVVTIDGSSTSRNALWPITCQ